VVLVDEDAGSILLDAVVIDEDVGGVLLLLLLSSWARGCPAPAPPLLDLLSLRQ
jgi:hypothetical protein